MDVGSEVQRTAGESVAGSNDDDQGRGEGRELMDVGVDGVSSLLAKARMETLSKGEKRNIRLTSNPDGRQLVSLFARPSFPTPVRQPINYHRAP